MVYFFILSGFLHPDASSDARQLTFCCCCWRGEWSLFAFSCVVYCFFSRRGVLCASLRLLYVVIGEVIFYYLCVVFYGTILSDLFVRLGRLKKDRQCMFVCLYACRFLYMLAGNYVSFIYIAIYKYFIVSGVLCACVVIFIFSRVADWLTGWLQSVEWGQREADVMLLGGETVLGAAHLRTLCHALILLLLILMSVSKSKYLLACPVLVCVSLVCECVTVCIFVYVCCTFGCVFGVACVLWVRVSV